MCLPSSAACATSTPHPCAAPCATPPQYRLGAAKLAVRLVNGRLMARAGAGQTVDVLDWLGRQPVPT